ncbi:TPA: ABC transporter substrate-binding protein, partial [Pseudomonas aeruginosa]
MSQTPSTQPLRRLVDRFRAGDLSRRDFVQRATALGVGLAAANVIASEVAAQSATPSDAASPVASPVAGFPDDGTEGQTRGAGGELRIIQSQAPSVLSTHRSTGSKDVYAASLVLEPLLTYFADGSLGPQLLASVPSVEDGTLSEDLTQVTLTLKEGLLWNDGEPVTSNDIVFTWKWVTTAENSSSNIELWGLIETIETTDDLTAVVTFSSPQV